MLKSGEEKKELFVEIESLVESLGLDVVEVSKNESHDQTNMRVVLYSKDRDITVDDLESAYSVIYPRYSVLLDSRDFSLEVSSPGLERSFKDYHEFTVFNGKRVRLYTTEYSTYVSGVIENTDDNTVTLTHYTIEDRKENGERISISLETIAKAKLDYSWEDKND